LRLGNLTKKKKEEEEVRVGKREIKIFVDILTCFTSYSDTPPVFFRLFSTGGSCERVVILETEKIWILYLVQYMSPPTELCCLHGEKFLRTIWSELEDEFPNVLNTYHESEVSLWNTVWTQGMNNSITPSEKKRLEKGKSVLEGHRGGRFNK
jgi:hypothetical protein